jgi:predicted Zn-dependent protease with MMP-like domain
MKQFPSIDSVHEMLEKIADEIPPVFFKDLNGGVILVEHAKAHHETKTDYPLYIMGEYHRSAIGRQIIIYYGSFRQAYGTLSEKKLYEKLKDTLLHEFTHHLENLAGERDLEIKDEQRMNAYRKIKSSNRG